MGKPRVKERNIGHSRFIRAGKEDNVAVGNNGRRLCPEDSDRPLSTTIYLFPYREGDRTVRASSWRRLARLPCSLYPGVRARGDREDLVKSMTKERQPTGPILTREVGGFGQHNNVAQYSPSWWCPITFCYRMRRVVESISVHEETMPGEVGIVAGTEPSVPHPHADKLRFPWSNPGLTSGWH